MTTSTRFARSGRWTRRDERDERDSARRADGVPPAHPLWERLESPLSTYYLLVGVVGILLAIGLVMVLSASSITSLKSNQSSFTVFLNQVKFAALGLVGAFLASRMPIGFWRRISLPLLLTAVTLQALVLSPLGLVVKGNRNWLVLGPLQIQPAELAKFALVVFGASVLASKRKLIGDWKHAVVPLVAPVGAILLGLVLWGHDLGTGLVMLAILAGLLWSAGVSWRLFAGAGLVAGAGVGAMVVLSANRMDRISSWLSCTDIQRCWQPAHGQYALAEGGLGGLGLGASREKWLWLPEPHNDFIFAIIGEELGLGGTLIILLLFAVLAAACYRVVMHSDDEFVRIATSGVLVWVIVQALVNIGAVIGLLPVIGVPLPLVSSGGSALISALVALGMVISFARAEPACRRALAARPQALRRSLSVRAGARKAARTSGRR